MTERRLTRDERVSMAVYAIVSVWIVLWLGVVVYQITDLIN